MSAEELKRAVTETDFSEIFKRARTMTQDNAHTEARLEIARITNHSVAAEVFRSLIVIKSADGDLRPDVSAIRERWTDSLITFVKIEYGECAEKAAHNAL